MFMYFFLFCGEVRGVRRFRKSWAQLVLSLDPEVLVLNIKILFQSWNKDTFVTTNKEKCYIIL